MIHAVRESDVIKAMDWDQYNSLDALRWSRLKTLAKSPAHYHYELTARGAGTDAMKVGRAVHCRVFEPVQFEKRYRVWNGGTRRGNEWEEFKLGSTGFDILTMKEELLVSLLGNAVRNEPDAARLIASGQAEVTVTGRVAIPAVGDFPAASWATKARLDFLGPHGIVDLKTAVDASPEKFARAAWNLSYLGQAAWYVDAVERATGKVVPFTFVAVEKSAPYVVVVYRVPDELLEVGRDHYTGLLHRLSLCERQGRWPGYVDGPVDLTIPRWAVEQEDEDMSDTGIEFNAESEASDGL